MFDCLVCTGQLCPCSKLQRGYKVVASKVFFFFVLLRLRWNCWEEKIISKKGLPRRVQTYLCVQAVNIWLISLLLIFFFTCLKKKRNLTKWKRSKCNLICAFNCFCQSEQHPFNPQIYPQCTGYLTVWRFNFFASLLLYSFGWAVVWSEIIKSKPCRPFQYVLLEAEYLSHCKRLVLFYHV